MIALVLKFLGTIGGNEIVMGSVMGRRIDEREKKKRGRKTERGVPFIVETFLGGQHLDTPRRSTQLSSPVTILFEHLSIY